jgi:hypothetical protein
MVSAVHIEFQDLLSATEATQLFVSDIAPNAVAAVGVASMMLTNFLASGIACGFFDDKFVDKIINTIRESVDDSVESIKVGLLEEAANQTIQ